jgi:hypothetical protein
MTKNELVQIVERLPERVLDDGSRRLELTTDDLLAMSNVIYELSMRLAALGREWTGRMGVVIDKPPGPERRG